MLRDPMQFSPYDNDVQFTGNTTNMKKRRLRIVVCYGLALFLLVTFFIGGLNLHSSGSDRLLNILSFCVGILFAVLGTFFDRKRRRTSGQHGAGYWAVMIFTLIVLVAFTVTFFNTGNLFINTLVMSFTSGCIVVIVAQFAHPRERL